MNIRTDQGWTEVVIHEDCDIEVFYEIASILEKEFKILFIKKLNGLDCSYWDFNYEGQQLTLHYNIYMGVSIFPQSCKESSVLNNKKLLKIGELLIEKLDNNIS
ncbi:MAG: DUF3630 family protein [Daejeonella sp.]